MSHHINPVAEDRYIFLSYEGEVPVAELSAARYETDAMLDQRLWHLLVVDVTQLQSALRTSELIDFAISQPTAQSQLAQRIRLLVNAACAARAGAAQMSLSDWRDVEREVKQKLQNED